MVGVARIEIATPAMSKPSSVVISRLFFNILTVPQIVHAHWVPTII
jgi:hypothetical protein